MATKTVQINSEETESTYFRYSCTYNEGVVCHPTVRPCETCGWNPEVARARLEEFCKEMGIAVPVIEPKKEEDELEA